MNSIIDMVYVIRVIKIAPHLT